MSKPKPHGPVGEQFMRHHYGAAKAAPQPPLNISLPPITINNDSKYYSDQVARMMREYGLAVRAAALEEAADKIERLRALLAEAVEAIELPSTVDCYRRLGDGLKQRMKDAALGGEKKDDNT